MGGLGLLRPFCSLDPLLMSIDARRRLEGSMSRAHRLLRHSVTAHLAGVGPDRLHVRLPSPEVTLGVGEDLPAVVDLGEGGALLAGDDGGVVEEVDEVAGALGEEDLFLGTLDDGGGVEVEGFLELLAGDVGELGVGDKGLGFGADEFLLEGDEFGGFGFFVLEFLNLVLDLVGD